MRRFIGECWRTAIIILIQFACLGLGYWRGSELAEKPEQWYARVVNEAVANAPSSCPDCGAAMSYRGLYRREFSCGSAWRAVDAGDDGGSAFLRIGVFAPAPNCHASEPNELYERGLRDRKSQRIRDEVPPRFCGWCGAKRNELIPSNRDDKTCIVNFECGTRWTRWDSDDDARIEDARIEILASDRCAKRFREQKAAATQPASAPESTTLPVPESAAIDNPGKGISFAVTEAEYAAHRRAAEDHIETLIPPEICPLCGKPATPELSDRDNRAYACGSSWTRHRYAEGRARSCVITDGCTRGPVIIDLNATTQPEARP